jgi:hypothetical protein
MKFERTNEIGNEIERKRIERMNELGNEIDREKELDNEIERNEIERKKFERTNEIGNEIECTTEIGNEIERTTEIGNEIERMNEFGNDIECKREINNERVNDTERTTGTAYAIECENDFDKEIERMTELGNETECKIELDNAIERKHENKNEIDNAFANKHENNTNHASQHAIFNGSQRTRGHNSPATFSNINDINNPTIFLDNNTSEYELDDATDREAEIAKDVERKKEILDNDFHARRNSTMYLHSRQRSMKLYWTAMTKRDRNPKTTAPPPYLNCPLAL